MAKHRFIFRIRPNDDDGNVTVLTTLNSVRAGKIDLEKDEIALLKEIAAGSNGRIVVEEK